MLLQQAKNSLPCRDALLGGEVEGLRSVNSGAGTLSIPPTGLHSLCFHPKALNHSTSGNSGVPVAPIPCSLIQARSARRISSALCGRGRFCLQREVGDLTSAGVAACQFAWGRLSRTSQHLSDEVDSSVLGSEDENEAESY